MALAWPENFESWSHGKPGQSHGFQAKPGWNITTGAIEIWAVRLPMGKLVMPGPASRELLRALLALLTSA